MCAPTPDIGLRSILPALRYAPEAFDEHIRVPWRRPFDLICLAAFRSFKTKPIRRAENRVKAALVFGAFKL